MRRLDQTQKADAQIKRRFPAREAEQKGDSNNNRVVEAATIKRWSR
jgi:hypothetical protein